MPTTPDKTTEQLDLTELADKIEAALSKKLCYFCPYCNAPMSTTISPENRRSLAEDLANNRVKIKMLQDDETKCSEGGKPFARLFIIDDDGNLNVETVKEEDFTKRMGELLTCAREAGKAETNALARKDREEVLRNRDFIRTKVAYLLAQIAGYNNPGTAFEEVSDEDLPNTLTTLLDNLPLLAKDPIGAMHQSLLEIAQALRFTGKGGKDGIAYIDMIDEAEDPYAALREMLEDITNRARPLREMLETFRAHFNAETLPEAARKAKETTWRPRLSDRITKPWER